MAIQLVTFGGLHVVDDESELDWLLGQHSRAALFVYLAVERRVSRDLLTTIFWPESDAENARHALRQSLYQLRKGVGIEWIESRAHELVVRGDVHVDALDFEEATGRGDVESAVRLYRGSFLDGVHLVDLKPWESWVDARRAQYARTFRKACRELIEARRASGDLAGAIDAAERWTAHDPYDDEAQHRLIDTLVAAGERTEALRQYETYARALEADGLAPAEETLELVNRLRSESAPLPTLRAVGVRIEPGTGATSLTPVSTDHERKTARRTRALLAAALGLALLVTSALLLRERRVQARSVAHTASIAVLPFSVRGGESLRYLGDGMVNLLGAALDGAGSMRPVDTRAVFAAAAEAGDSVPGLRQGARVASRLSASMFVLGDVVGAGGQLHMEAAVYRLGADCGGRRPQAGASGECVPGEPSTRAVVSGAADSVFTLVDRLAARLLAGLGEPAADRLLRTASLTTNSLSAFKAYLQGEALMRAGEFERAADAYLAAIALDSTFAVAHYRLALAREWAPLPGQAEAASAAVRHGARLSTRDRNLLEAFREWRAGNATQADRSYRAILARYPDDVDAWFQLGEIQFHQGPLLGRPVGESEEAWRKVLSYEPHNRFARTHLARIAVAGERVAALDSLLTPFAREELHGDRRLVEIELLRVVARADLAAARELAGEVRNRESLSMWRAAAWLTAFSPDPAMTRAVIEQLIDDHAGPAVRADVHWFASMLELARGRVGAASAARAEAVEAERGAAAERRRPEFDAVTEWFAATLPLPYADSTLLRVRGRAASLQLSSRRSRSAFENEMGMGATLRLEPLRQYTLGILSLRLRDTEPAVAAAVALQRFAASSDANGLIRDLDRGLRARLAWHEGRPEEALRLVQALELGDSQGDIGVIPFVSRVNERFLRAELLASLGRDAEALRSFASIGHGSVTEIPLRALSHLRQAEIHERLNDREQSAKHHARFLELWREGDPEFRQFASAARQRLVQVPRRLPQ